MASRSLTDVFVLMRSNAIRNKNIYCEQEDSEQMRLVSLNDLEEGSFYNSDIRMPPPWIDQLERCQNILTSLKEKIDELKVLQRNHLHKPTFDDSKTDEKAVENCVHELTRLFNEAHRLIQTIKSHSYDGNYKEKNLTVNVYRTLINSLQDLSHKFKTTQNSYLNERRSRENRSQIYFEDQFVDFGEENDEIDEDFMGNHKSQLMLFEEENTRFALEREEEVNAIVHSIGEVNKIFKELSLMVADQGTVLDRIDYNIEQAQVEVYEGYKQLKKADAYQRKNRKMCAIAILAFSTILLFFILILVKS